MSLRKIALLVLGGLLAVGCGSTQEKRPPVQPVAATSQKDVPVLSLPPEPGGIGSIQARTESGDAGYLSLQTVMVSARQRGDMAEVSVEHVFHNDSDATLEGTFRFPMPDGAVLTGLAMEIGGKLMEGELVERDKARKIYEAIVDAMQDPALLEWEQGSTFKLRVFPIEPKADKRVVLRYLAPLWAGKDGLVFVQGTRGSPGDQPVPRVTVRFDDRVAFDEANVRPGRIVEVPAKAVASILREERPDGAYVAVRLNPNWSKVPKTARAVPRHLLVVADTSRSTLEERKLMLEALRTVLASVPKESKFRVYASDLETRAQPEGFAAPASATIERAVAFVESIRPDGASDLGAMIRRVAAEAKGLQDPAIVYVGDAEPTWGELDPARLVELVNLQLGKVPFHVLVIGGSVNLDLAERLADATGGTHTRALRREALAPFAAQLSRPSRRIASVEIKAPAGVTLLPSGRLTLEPGRATTLLLKGKPDFRVDSIQVLAKVAGKTLDLMPKADPVNTPSVARRFGAAWVHELERSGAPKEEIVKASLDSGVMSKHTSFLVLESEEAYAKNAITRRDAQAESNAPRVTGSDLESLDGDPASINLTRIQPGDPEISIDAPRDARVVVVFPFGETKPAVYDPAADSGRGTFMVRFLVDRNTKEGEYVAVAHVFHRDGRHETSQVKYVVDNSAPRLAVELLPAAERPGYWEVRVTQECPSAERDLRRVEILLPSGRTRRLVAVAWADFRGYVPCTELPAGSVLRVVGVDQALNQAVREVSVP